MTAKISERDYPEWNEVDRIRFAQDYYRFSELVGLRLGFGRPIEIAPPSIYVWGRHALGRDGLNLPTRRLHECGRYQRLFGVHLLAIEMNAGLEKAIPNRLFDPDQNIRAASEIVRLLRNAFAHDPLRPKWQISARVAGRTLSVECVKPQFKLDTAKLDGQIVQRRHFGGPLALLALSEFVVKLIASHQQRSRRRTPSTRRPAQRKAKRAAKRT
jgi:hypothetical protein